MVAEGDVIGKIHDGRGWMLAGLLFFRWQQETFRGSLFFLVRREDLFRSFWATRVVVLSDYGWWFWTTTQVTLILVR